MVPWLRICSLVSLTVVVAPVSACGPFLYDNADLDHFSLLDPGILNSSEWVNFLAFASPALGQDSLAADKPAVQAVIHSDRLPDVSTQGVSNLLYDYEPGTDPLSLAANEAWWTDYFQTVRKRTVGVEELQKVLYGPDRPKWLVNADRQYLNVLDGPADDSATLKKALVEARNAANPAALRHRWAFWAVRAMALGHNSDAVKVFEEFSPGPATDLPLARAQGWAASVLVETDPAQALDLWLDLFARWPALRVQTFSSLSYLDSNAWKGAQTKQALLAKFFLDGRDFSPETLSALAAAEKTSGGDGGWTESVFYAMAEQVEREAGVFALFNLVDPQEVSPKGLFTGLIDRAQELVEKGVQPASRTWWLVASYLALFDGDSIRASALLDRARALPALNSNQDRQADLLAALIEMGIEKDKDWSPALQNQILAALDWGKNLDAPGHNRGLYHSVAILIAQKELSRGHDPQAVMAFGLVQKGGWGNPYSVNTDDGFWTVGWAANNSVNLMMDALMTDEDIATWKTLLTLKEPDPLTARLTSHSFVNERDLTWWQAHRALRRGQGEQALALLKLLGPARPDLEKRPPLFPEREFSYSLDLDPLSPAEGRGMRTVSPSALAGVMIRMEDEARLRPTSKSLLARGQFWLSLQLSGLPLLFSQPPKVISFVNGNFEYYGYDGRDSARTTAAVGTFPLGQAGQTQARAKRLVAFYRDEFSTLGRARSAFEAVLARHDDPDAEFRALLFLQAIDHDRYSALADPRYEAVPLAQTFRSTCEDFQGFLDGAEVPEAGPRRS